jgi:cellulose synthase/poly-beta-1,6-N-acetylglucosamine synthase-like glycosyltransferase
MLPYLSVILPVRNERQLLPELLDQLLEQNYPPELYEILVVDGQSTDGTGDLVARRYSKRKVRVRVIDNPKRNAAAGRNLGIRAAAGDAMLFLSGRCALASKDLLAYTAELLETTPEAACFCQPRPLLAPPGTRMGEAIARVWASRLGRRPELPELAGFVDVPMGAAIYRRGVFEKVGFFDESFEACEDEDFNIRVWKCVIQGYSDPRLAVYDRPRSTVGAFWRQMIRYGRGTSRLMRKHPEQSQVTQIAPLGVVLAVLLGLLAWNQLPWMLAGIVTLPLALFPVAMFVAMAQLGTRFGVRTAWKAPWILAAIYGGQGIGLFLEYAFPRRERKPKRATVAAGVVVDAKPVGESLSQPGQAA